MKKMVKKKKIGRKSSVRRKKSNNSDAFKAFMLASIIVTLSALISCAVIMVHSSLQNEESIDPAVLDTQKAPVPTAVPEFIPEITEKPPTPDISPVSQAPQAVQTPQTTAPSQRRTRESSGADRTQGEVSQTTSVAAGIANSAAVTSRPPAENRGSLVFVIDDAGNNLRELEPFLKIPGPLTIAVLPGLPNSAEAARRIRAAGKEVILHQPMEAIGAQDPGPGAIYSGMSANEIRSILAKNVAEVGPVKGINNHQGSKITMDTEAMQTILAFCVEHNLYFLDSRTTADSVAGAVARQMKIKIAERNVFIDNEQNKDAMSRYISNGLTRAQRNGSVVMIGHVWSPDLAPLLTEQFPLFESQGYTLKTAYDIIN
jgi:polysaccharide deacetylase 2 family uncharacterized protein YibQ